jgi:hypothetical protein
MTAAVAGALIVLLAAMAPPAAAGPMQGGGDTRDLASTPLFSNFSRVVVRPGEASVVSFDVQNRYNATLFGAQVALEFHVGGDWLEAKSIQFVPNPPEFERTPQLPEDLARGEVLHVERRFTTNAQTPPGTYLVSVEMQFTYLNSTGVPTAATVRSLGALSGTERGNVDMSHYNASIAALGIDAVAPDTSVTVDGGQAGALFAYATAFGVATFAAMVVVGYTLSRRARGRRRKPL